MTYGLQLYVLRREQGRLGEMEDLVRRSVGSTRPIRSGAACSRSMAAELGHAAEAREVLEALAADSFATLPFDEEWLVSMRVARRGGARLS